MGRVRHSTLCIWLIGVWALVGCKVYDSGKIESMRGGTAGTGGDRDGGGGGGGGEPSTDGGTDAGPCLVPKEEACNLIDDDCDGLKDDVDEDTRRACAASIPNAAVAECVELRGEARCVLRDCLDGFDNCDGLPSNGCEPYCMCHDCPSDDDAGTDPDTDGGVR